MPTRACAHDHNFPCIDGYIFAVVSQRLRKSTIPHPRQRITHICHRAIEYIDTRAKAMLDRKNNPTSF